MKSCRRLQRLLARAFDGCLTLDESFWMEEHLRDCESCRAEEAKSRALGEALRCLPAPPVEHLDVARSLTVIHAGIDGGQQQPGRRRQRTAPLWTVAAAAAALLACWAIVQRGAEAPDGSPLAQPVSALPAERAPEPIPAFIAPPLDRNRLSAARAEVRTRLCEAADVARDPRGALDAERLAADFERNITALAAAGWPVVRIVERLTGEPDAPLARAALCYLGRRADRTSMGVITDALQLSDRKHAALYALIDAGADGRREGLRHALRDPELRGEVLAHLSELAPEPAVAWVVEELRAARHRRPSDAERALARSCLSVLSGAGAAGAGALVGLAGHPLLERTALLEALATNPAAGEVLAEAVLAPAADGEFLLEAVARFHPQETLDWTLELCESRHHRARALEALAGFDESEAIEGLLALRADAPGVDDALRTAWRRAVERDPERLCTLALRWTDEGRRDSATRFLEALVLSESAAAVPALTGLAASDLLDDDDRERALLAVAEIGEPEHVAGLAELFAGLGPRDRELAAACLLALHELDPSGGALRVLRNADHDNRILDLLNDRRSRRGSAVTLFQLAQELRPLLAANRTETRRTSP